MRYARETVDLFGEPEPAPVAAPARPRMGAEPDADVAGSGELYPCGSCGRFGFNRPTVCWWCRGG